MVDVLEHVFVRLLGFLIKELPMSLGFGVFAGLEPQAH